MYSLSTSFWVVPRSCSLGTPCSSPTSSYSSSRQAAGALIVIDVETWSSGMPSKAVRMSSIVSIATPVRPDLAEAARVVGVQAELGGQVERHRQPGRALGEQVAVALVGLLRRGVARVLAHRPRLLAVHLAVHAARVGELAGLAELELLRQVGLGVELGDLDPRVGEAARVVGPDDRGDGQVLLVAWPVGGSRSRRKGSSRADSADSTSSTGILPQWPPVWSPAAPASSARICATSCSRAGTA